MSEGGREPEAATDGEAGAGDDAAAPEVFAPWPPTPDRDSAPYWEALREGELRLQRCGGCGALRWPARAFCNRCRSFEFDWERVSGRGTVVSAVRTHQVFAPALRDAVPFDVVQVRLADQDDVLMIGGWLGDERPAVGAPVELELVDGPEGFRLPCWRPAPPETARRGRGARSDGGGVPGWVRKLGLGLAAALTLLLVGGLAFVWWIGAWGILFPSDHHDATPPAIAADWGRDARLRVLVYSKTNSFRHKEGIAAAHALFDRIAERRGWAVWHAENSALLALEELARFDVVVFANATGDHASDAQDADLRAWLEAGGGWVGIHAAGDGSHAGWRWYTETLIGGEYLGHILGPQTQEARVVVEARDHPVTRGLPADFRHAEEWYSWDRSARAAGFEVLLHVDESTYEPFIRGLGEEQDIRMGDHPVVWARCVDRGRAVYSAMGHWGAAYRVPEIARLLENAVAWTGGLSGGDECRPESATLPRSE